MSSFVRRRSALTSTSSDSVGSGCECARLELRKRRVSPRLSPPSRCRRRLKRCDADEVEGLETFFDPWREKLWQTLENLDIGLGKGPGAGAEGVTSAAPAEPLPTGVPPPQQQEEEEADGLGSSAEQPLLAPVVAARWLTAEEADDGEAGGEARRVLHVELDVSAAGRVMKFEAGDAIAVVPHHDDATVSEALRHCHTQDVPLPPLAVPLFGRCLLRRARPGGFWRLDTPRERGQATGCAAAAAASVLEAAASEAVDSTAF